MTRFARPALFLALCLTTAIATAGTLKSGNYVVRYSVINSMQIPAAVAKENAIEQRSNRAIVTITLQRPTESAPFKAVPARVTGTAGTLTGKNHTLDFRRVTATNSTYSLAAIPLTENKQTVTIDLEITTLDGSRLIPLTFTKKLYRRQ